MGKRVEKLSADDMKEILYPRRFHSQDEVETYVNGDRIVCLICDKTYENLAAHISRGHGCEPRDYRDILNIPRTVSLCTPDYLKSLAEKARYNYHNVVSDEHREFLSKTVHNPMGKSGWIVSTISKQAVLLAARLKGKNCGKKHGRTSGKCHDCQKEIEISTQRVNRRTLCSECLRLSRAAGLKKTYEKNKEHYDEYRRNWYIKKRAKQRQQ